MAPSTVTTVSATGPISTIATTSGSLRSSSRTLCQLSPKRKGARKTARRASTSLGSGRGSTIVLKNGRILHGQDFETYCECHGLCHICGHTQTHSISHKGLFGTRGKRNHPLTDKDDATGEYTIYNGYCIQATCYTLEQAQKLSAMATPLQPVPAQGLSPKRGSSRSSRLQNVGDSSASNRNGSQRRRSSFSFFSSSSSPESNHERGTVIDKHKDSRRRKTKGSFHSRFSPKRNASKKEVTRDRSAFPTQLPMTPDSQHDRSIEGSVAAALESAPPVPTSTSPTAPKSAATLGLAPTMVASPAPTPSLSPRAGAGPKTQRVVSPSNSPNNAALGETVGSSHSHSHTRPVRSLRGRARSVSVLMTDHATNRNTNRDTATNSNSNTGIAGGVADSQGTPVMLSPLNRSRSLSSSTISMAPPGRGNPILDDTIAPLVNRDNAQQRSRAADHHRLSQSSHYPSNVSKLATVLDFSSQPQLCAKDVRAILGSLCDGKKTLLLDHCAQTDSTLEEMVNALRSNPPDMLKVLCLRSSGIDDEGARYIGQMLQLQPFGSNQLQTLRLSHNRIADLGASRIFRTLQFATVSSLTCLSLTSNHITVHAGKGIGEALAENCTLQSLLLDHNTLGDEGIKCILQSLGQNTRSALRKLSMCSNEVTDVGASAVSDYIQSVSRHSNRASGHTTSARSTSNTSNVGASDGSNEDPLEIDLANNRISDEGAGFILGAMQQSILCPQSPNLHNSIHSGTHDGTHNGGNSDSSFNIPVVNGLDSNQVGSRMILQLITSLQTQILDRSSASSTAQGTSRMATDNSSHSNSSSSNSCAPNRDHLTRDPSFQSNRSGRSRRSLPPRSCSNGSLPPAAAASSPRMPRPGPRRTVSASGSGLIHPGITGRSSNRGTAGMCATRGDHDASLSWSMHRHGDAQHASRNGLRRASLTPSIGESTELQMPEQSSMQAHRQRSFRLQAGRDLTRSMSCRAPPTHHGNMAPASIHESLSLPSGHSTSMSMSTSMESDTISSSIHAFRPQHTMSTSSGYTDHDSMDSISWHQNGGGGGGSMHSSQLQECNPDLYLELTEAFPDVDDMDNFVSAQQEAMSGLIL